MSRMLNYWGRCAKGYFFVMCVKITKDKMNKVLDLLFFWHEGAVPLHDPKRFQPF